MDDIGRELKRLKGEIKELEEKRAYLRREYRKRYYQERIGGPERLNPWRKK